MPLSVKVWVAILAVAVVSTYLMTARKKSKNKSQEKAKKKRKDRQTQTEPNQPINHSQQNIPIPRGKMGQIKGIIVKSYVNDTYRMQLMNNEQTVTRYNLKIPKQFVQINPNKHNYKQVSDVKAQQQDEDNESTQIKQQSEQTVTNAADIVPIVPDDNDNEQKQDDYKQETVLVVQIDPVLRGITDIASIRLSYDKSCYHIGSIKYIDPLITCQYPYLGRNIATIPSSYDPNTIYFFNTGHNFNYKYIINTKEWKKIAVVPEEHELKSNIKCFYLNYKQGLIGLICSKEVKIRIYNEVTDEWSCLEMQIKDKVKGKGKQNESTAADAIKIGNVSLALDTRNMIYHFVDFRNHFTYNLNTFELYRIADRIPFSGESDGNLIYIECGHCLIYLADFFGRGMERIYEYDITKEKWNEWNCTFSNFEPGDWASKYRNFGYLNLNNMNKIITFGGRFCTGSKSIASKYLFELDVKTKTWTVLNFDLYFMNKTFNVGAFFVEPFQTDDGYFTINVLDKEWSELGSCNHVMIELKGCDKEEKELYAQPNSISIKFSNSTNERDIDEKDDIEFDEIEKNKETGALRTISTDFRSEGIEILDGNTYNIKYIEVSDELTRHNANQCCIVQSVYDLNILYFFNASYKDYKYNMNTRKWKRIAEMDKEYQVSGDRGKNAFYIDVEKGLIGITGDWNTRNKSDIKIERFLRIYHEFTNEWTCEPLREQKLNLITDSNNQHKRKHWEISRGSVALDSKNKMYHIVLFSNHVTYNIQSKEWTELGNPPFSGEKNPCLIYNKYDETLYYVGGFFEKLTRMHCYKIKENRWTTVSLQCDNFEASDTKYDHFGVLHLSGMHKILTFGGTFGSKDVDYIFELDLKKKKWKLLEPNIYKLPQKIHIWHMIAQKEADNAYGQYKVDIFNEAWSGGGDSNQIRLTMYIDQKKVSSNDDNRYFQGKYIMPKRIKQERREKKKKEKKEKKKEEEKEVYVHPFEKKAGIVVCGYVRDLFGEIFVLKMDINILRSISLYFCFGLVDFSGIWEIKKDTDKQLYKYDEFENEDIEDLAFVGCKFVGYIHSMKHDLYNNTIKMKNHYSVTTSYKGGFSSGCHKCEEQIDCKEFQEINKNFKQFRKTKWSQNQTQLITVLRKKEKEYTVHRWIQDNKYFIKLSNGEKEIKREYYRTDSEPEEGCLIM